MSEVVVVCSMWRMEWVMTTTTECYLGTTFCVNRLLNYR